jgi:hypothetical protein
MKQTEKLIETYKQYCLAEGNQYIASEYAVLKLQELIKNFEIRSVLEVGLGIGSISGSLLNINNHIEYSGTESNDFCLKALKENLGLDYDRLEVLKSIRFIPQGKKFDLIIIDGKDPNLESIRNFISNRSIIVLEGDRKNQQNTLKEIFPGSKQVHSISLSKNKTDSPFGVGEWQGGLKTIFINPNSRQYAWWFKERFLTKLKYQYPGRFFGNIKI